MALRRLRGLAPSVARQLFTSTVAAVMDYSSNVWMHACSEALIRPLNRVQNVGGQAIVGTLRTVATAVAEAETGILPVRQRLARRATAFWVNLNTLPDNHPLATTERRMTKRFTSPLQRHAASHEGVPIDNLEVQKPWKGAEGEVAPSSLRARQSVAKWSASAEFSGPRGPPSSWWWPHWAHGMSKTHSRPSLQPCMFCYRNYGAAKLEDLCCGVLHHLRSALQGHNRSQGPRSQYRQDLPGLPTSHHYQYHYKLDPSTKPVITGDFNAHHASWQPGIRSNQSPTAQPSYADRHHASFSNPKSYEDYTIAIICAISFEMTAVRYMLDNDYPYLRVKPGDSNTYKLGDIYSHNVVLACLPGQQGKGAAAAAAAVAVNISRTFPSIK
ncbi:uncharacterized protein VDAG_02406 [Verticillium dahliae VdLs.17]|uniref:Uncharacterized protein n=1 Tax=Verticillium dahliae (strain VdLs.17 / ATCC MYA-4575 / FGSC 10137) TaxID=498257 RepID=G2WXS4_VERDV|nr:uncharacterized protein VDAG_02406 [Verticillium dahliae VdLs.17]EGY20882.1 hypothetical protein VDAG_02406 [Verticillium dahliae VdLs.17]